MAPASARRATRASARGAEGAPLVAPLTAAAAARNTKRAANILPVVASARDNTYGAAPREVLGEEPRPSSRQSFAGGLAGALTSEVAGERLPAGSSRGGSRSPLAGSVASHATVPEADETGNATLFNTSNVGVAQGVRAGSEPHVREARPTSAATGPSSNSNSNGGGNGGDSSSAGFSITLSHRNVLYVLFGACALALVFGSLIFFAGRGSVEPPVLDGTGFQRHMKPLFDNALTHVEVTVLTRVDALSSDLTAQARDIADLEKRVRALEPTHDGPNFFSPWLGAAVDESKTSPTKLDYPGSTSLWDSLWRKKPVMAQFPPITALQPFNEAGECWCAAQAADGGSSKAQITVNMAFEVYPTAFTYEHIHKADTPNVRSAPKDLELWVAIPDKYLAYVKMTKDPNNEWDRIRDPSLPKNFVRIQKLSYNPDTADATTAYLDPIIGDSQGHSVPISAASVRSTSNHGASHTCFYRLLLHGSPVENPGEEIFGY